MWQRNLINYFAAVGLILLVTFILIPFQPEISVTTAALCLLLTILLIAAFSGRNPALLAAMTATICFNYFFLPPIYTLRIDDEQNWIALAAFLTTAIVAGQLSARARERADKIERLYDELQIAFEQTSRVEALSQSEKLKSALLDAVTHDLRTPLTSIKAAVTTLIHDQRQDDSIKLDDEGRWEFFDVINEETDRLNRFIENMIELARLEAGALHLRRRWSGVDEIIETALERASKLLKNHRIKVEIERELPLVQADAKALAEVVYTLLDNAAKYSPDGTEISVKARRFDDENVEIAICDQGKGVEPKMRDKVFEKFFRVSLADQETNADGGLGLGLAVARGIIESHNGKIWMTEGAQNRGTCVAFVVPVGDEDE